MELKQLHAVNSNEMEWEGTRFPECFIKVLSFRDKVNFELDKFEPGGYTFPHQHLFWQLRYVLEGEFIVNGHTYGPGTLIDFPEKTIYEVSSPKGGVWIILQMPGVTTGMPPSDPTGLEYGMAPPRKKEPVA
jgi:hypothetical protein